MNLLLSCKDVVNFIPDYQEGVLASGLRLRMGLHLKACKPCQAMLNSLQALPGLFRKAISEEAPASQAAYAQAKVALDAALVRLKAGGRLATGSLIERRSAHPMPSTVSRALADGTADRPMRLLAAAHEAIQAKGSALAREPFLPQAVLDELPPPDKWKWVKTLMNGCSSAMLTKDPSTGASLHMILLPPGRRFPDHLHRGDEHVLLLAGQAEDTQFYGVAGDWFHQVKGTEHRELEGRGDDVCWTLTRLQGGGIQLEGWRGAVQSMLEKVS